MKLNHPFTNYKYLASTIGGLIVITLILLQIQSPLSFFSQANIANNVYFSIEPSPDNPNPITSQTPFTAIINLHNPHRLTLDGYEVHLEFTPQLVKVDQITNTDNFDTPIISTFNNQAGTIHIERMQLNNNPIPTEKVSIATITFLPQSNQGQIELKLNPQLTKIVGHPLDNDLSKYLTLDPPTTPAKFMINGANPSPTPTPSIINNTLITNGEFSNGTTGWQFYTNGTSNFTVNNEAARVELKTTGNNTQLFQSGFSVKSGQKYTIQLRAKADKPTPMGLFLHRHTSGYESIGLDQTIQLTTTWQSYVYSFTPKSSFDNNRLRFWFVGSQTNNSIFIDDVKLIGQSLIPTSPTTPTPTIPIIQSPTPSIITITPTIPISPTPTSIPTTIQSSPTPIPTTIQTNNLITNPGFENGTNNWTFYTTGSGNYSAQSPGYTGNQSAVIAITNPGNNVQLYQNGFLIKPGKKYQLHFAVKANRNLSLQATIHRHGSPYESIGLFQNINASTSWQVHNLDFTTTNISNVNDARLRFWLTSLNSGDILYIDEVKLQEL